MRVLVVDAETNDTVDDMDLEEFSVSGYVRAVVSGKYRTILYERTPIEAISRDDLQDEGC